jgi:hypothetical protein
MTIHPTSEISTWDDERLLQEVRLCLRKLSDLAILCEASLERRKYTLTQRYHARIGQYQEYYNELYYEQIERNIPDTPEQAAQSALLDQHAS